MNNPFYYSDDNKRYHTLAYYNKTIFQRRIYKASLVIGCLCPNFDGKVSTGGCSFCDGPQMTHKPILQQLKNEKDRIHSKVKNSAIIAYFQTGSNTYCSPEYLYECCNTVLKSQDVIGISIGTRADCISTEILKVLTEINKKTYLTIELGLQSIHDETAKRMNRGHTFKDFILGFNAVKESNIRTCVHLINSLPYETEEMMIESAKVIGKLCPDAVKIHMLHIMEGTRIAKEYKAHPFVLLSQEEYVKTVVKQLEYIPQKTVIERLTGDGEKNRLIAPLWTRDKLKTLVDIDKYQVLTNSFQGKHLL